MWWPCVPRTRLPALAQPLLNVDIERLGDEFLNPRRHAVEHPAKSAVFGSVGLP
jgi:hypothetical protein